MQSEFRLAKVKGGVGHFARVEVRAEAAPAGVEAHAHIVGELGNHRYPYFPASEWVEAAVRGAQRRGEALMQGGKARGWRIIVTRVWGTACDTIPEDAACASALATWQLLLPSIEVPPFDFVDGKWHFQLPGFLLHPFADAP